MMVQLKTSCCNGSGQQGIDQTKFRVSPVSGTRNPIQLMHRMPETRSGMAKRLDPRAERRRHKIDDVLLGECLFRVARATQRWCLMNGHHRTSAQKTFPSSRFRPIWRRIAVMRTSTRFAIGGWRREWHELSCHLGRKMLDRMAQSGSLDGCRQTTWKMSVYSNCFRKSITAGAN